MTKECLTSADAVPHSLKLFTAADAAESRANSHSSLLVDVGDEAPIEVEIEADDLEDSEYCLLSVDVSNIHREDVLLRFALNTGGVMPLHLYRVLRAGAITKIILPQPRIELDPSTGKPFNRSSPSSTHVEGKASDDSFPPIPSIWKEGGNRQFIVSKIQLGKEEEKEVRRNFWYREALFSRLSGAWRTLPTGSSSLYSVADGLIEGGAEGEDAVRSGRVPLRGLVSGGGLALDTYALGCLQKDPVKVLLVLNDGEPVHAERFVTVQVSITNRLTRPIKPLIRLVPTHPTGTVDAALLDSIIVSDGTFTASNPNVGQRKKELQRGEAKVVDWEVTFLSPGKYGFLVVVEEATSGTGEGKREREGRGRGEVGFRFRFALCSCTACVTVETLEKLTTLEEIHTFGNSQNESSSGDELERCACVFK